MIHCNIVLKHCQDYLCRSSLLGFNWVDVDTGYVCRVAFLLYLLRVAHRQPIEVDAVAQTQPHVRICRSSYLDLNVSRVCLDPLLFMSNFALCLCSCCICIHLFRLPSCCLGRKQAQCQRELACRLVVIMNPF